LGAGVVVGGAAGAVEVEDGGAVFEGGEPEVVAPEQLEEQPVGGLVGDTMGLVAFDFVVDVSRGDATAGMDKKREKSKRE